MLRIGLLIVCLLPLWLCAQLPYTKNTWRLPDTLHRVRFIFLLDDRFSILHGTPVQFFGIKTGAQVHQRWRTGVGFFFNRKHVVVKGQTNPAYPDKLLREKTRFYYGTLFAEFIPLKRMRWEIAIPMHLGFGGAVIDYHNQLTAEKIGRRSEFIALTEITPLVTFRMCRWFGVGAGAGYRFIFNRDKELKKAYDAPIIMLRLKFYFNELFRMVLRDIKKKKPDKNIPAPASP